MSVFLFQRIGSAQVGNLRFGIIPLPRRGGPKERGGYSGWFVITNEWNKWLVKENSSQLF